MFQEIGSKLLPVKHAESWGVVESPPTDNASRIDSNEEVEAVAPCSRVIQEAVRHARSQRARRRGHEVAVAVGDVSARVSELCGPSLKRICGSEGNRPPFHRNQLCNDPKERLLESDGDANEHLGYDESVDILRNCADNGAKERDRAAKDEEPTSSENAVTAEHSSAYAHD